jgi:hypothetical protein
MNDPRATIRQGVLNVGVGDYLVTIDSDPDTTVGIVYCRGEVVPHCQKFVNDLAVSFARDYPMISGATRDNIATLVDMLKYYNVGR